MSAHTPGPWVAFDSSPKFIGETARVGVHANSGDVAHCHGFSGRRGLEEEKANTRLIAAAPELLAACEAALLAKDCQQCQRKAFAQMAAAVDKATRAST